MYIIHIIYYVYIYKFTSKRHSQTIPSTERKQPGPGVLLAPSSDNQTRNYNI